MSEQQRNHSEFRRLAAAGHDTVRRKPAGADLWLTPDSADLRLLEPRENKKTQGGDPYNGMGSRAAASRALRK